MSRLKDRLSRLSPEKRALLERRLAEKSRGRVPEDGHRDLRIPRREERGPAPLSSSQERLWLLHRLSPGGAYNDRLVLRLEGTLDQAALRRSVSEILRRHEVLRSRFPERDGVPVQVADPPGPPPLSRIDLTGLVPPEKALPEILGRAARRVPDLAAAPPVWMVLVRLTPREHVFAVAMHHIVTDGWSWGIFLRELGMLYGAFVEGRPSPLPELPIQYADFAAWQRSALESERLRAELGYWRDRLAGLPPALDLPTDRPRPAAQSFRGATRSLTLSAELANELTAFGQSRSATVFMVLLSALASVLHDLSGEVDFAVGTPVLGRHRRETEGLIGSFINTVVLRIDTSGSPSFAELLERTRHRTAEAFAHQEVPFDQVVEAVQPERSLARAPLFQVMIDLQEEADPEIETGGLTVSPVSHEVGTTRFDLVLNIEQRPGRDWTASLQYAVELFDATTIERMLRRFGALLAAAVRDPEQPLRRLVPTSPAERQLLLWEWNDRHAELPTEVPLRAIELQARSTPERIAVAQGTAQVSYGELERRAEALAARLVGAGAGRGELVGIALERSIELVVAVLAVGKTGGAYLPLDPGYPEERLKLMISDGGVLLVLVGGAGRSGIGDGVRSVEAGQTLAAEGDVPAAREIDGRDLAYVIYTSGSTGRPKGVEIEHRSLGNFLGSMRRRPGLAETDVLFSVTSLSFDIAGLELMLPLLCGARVVLADPGATSDGALLGKLVEDSRATVMQATPSTWRMLVESGWSSPADLQALCGGEELPRDLAAALAGRTGELWNLYGPTETTVWSSVTRVEPGVPPSIGRPIANTRMTVVGPHFRPTPIGVAGELCIGGAGVARGYRNRHGLTAERFVPDPWGEPGSRLYRTGDLARWSNEGHLDYLGRIDHQVKIRGFRIELGEIEAALAERPEVRQAVVVSRRIAGDPRLVAYVVAEAGEESDPDRLREALLERLPGHMVPSTFETLGELPLTPNGKVDRRALPEPRTARQDVALVPPRSQLEEELVAIWKEVLGIAQLGVEDDFFTSGGHSLLANRVVARIRSVLGFDVPLRALFEAPTVAGLAQRIQRREAGGTGPTLAPPRTVPAAERAVGPVPVSPAQRRLWFLHALDPTGTAYDIPEAVRIQGRLVPAALKHALAETVRRHEVLRTTFAPEADGEPVQHIGPPWRPALPAVDLSGVPAERREPEARRLAEVLARARFDLERGPLLEAALLRLDQRDHVFLLTVHHIVTDGWSMRLLVREITAAYRRVLAGEPPAPPPALQYADFVRWHRRVLSDERLEETLEHWTRRLAGVPTALALPADRPWPAVQRSDGDREPFELDRKTTEALARLARGRGATLFMSALAGFAALLERYTAQSPVLVGSPVAHRPFPEFEEMLGLFLNTLVLRMDLRGRTTFLELLDRARETVLDADAHQELPFETLVDALDLPRDLSRPPLFQVMLVFQDLPDRGTGPEGLRLGRFEFEPAGAQYELHLSLRDSPDGLAGALTYRTQIFDRTTIRRLAGHLGTLLREAVRRPDLPLRDLPLLDRAERHQLIREWNGLPEASGPRSGLYELFVERARLHPEAEAVRFAGERVSYGELARRTVALGARLGALGCGPELRVAVAMERSVELVVALLGVLAAGGAYVPVDPDYPADRLELMLEDCDALALLTAEDLADRLPPFAGPVLAWDGSRWKGPEGREESRTPGCIDSSQLAYTIFTSGSTGRPKGAMVHHAAIRNRLAWMQEAYGLTPSDTVLQKTPYSFDVSVWEFFWPLMAGSRLVLAAPGGHKDAAYLVGLIARERVTVVHFVPSMLQAFVEERRLEDLDSLRLVVASGEALPADLTRRVAERLPGARLENLYGPTEAAVDVTRWSCHPEGERGAVPIGRPIAGTQIHLVDQRALPVPLGALGELLIGGVNVGRGYTGRPALTAERFVPDPWGGKGSRLYRTGDLARRLPTGEIEFRGRLDHQVKVRGFRIELGEIEAVLGEQAGVREAVAVARERSGSVGLVAYVAPERGGDPPDGDALRSTLAASLPDFMVPSAIEVLEELPLLPNGKVDRAALPEPTFQDDGGASRAPETPLERAVLAVWSEVLGNSSLGAEDDFFARGGDSIHAVRVVSSINAKLGTALRVEDLFRRSTIAGLAEMVEAGTGAEDEGGPAADRARGAEEIVAFRDAVLRGGGGDADLPANAEALYPLSGIEQGMAYYTMLVPDEPMYVDQYAYLLELRDLERFFHAFELLVDRHATLRSSFYMHGFDQPVKIVRRALPVPREIEDLTALPEDRRRERIDRYRDAELAAGFELAGEPLWRLRLFRVSENVYSAVWTYYHGLLDGWSNNSLWAELNDLYGRPDLLSLTGLPPLASSYEDYLALALGRRTSPEAEAFWRRHLEGSSRSKLPFGRARRSSGKRGVRRRTRRLGMELAERLRARASDLGVSLQALCLSAYVTLLFTITGEDDLITGVVSNDRPPLPDGDRIVGCFLNSLPLRVRAGSMADGLSLIRHVDRYLREKKIHEMLLVDIADRLGERGENENPFFDTLFNFMDFHVFATVRRNEIFGPMTSEDQTGRYEMRPEEMTNTLFDLEVSTTLDGFSFWIKYAPSYFSDEETGKALDLFESTLERFAEEPAFELRREALVGREARQWLVGEFNDTRRDYPRERPLHSLFEEQARKAPDREAVVCGGRRLSYEQLDRAANRLARHLAALGARPGESVGVVLPRSVELAVALLGVLKSGASYVPLEPAYPAERKAYVLRQSEARWAICAAGAETALGDVSGIVPVHLGDPVLTAREATPPPLVLRPGDLAYTIYTSGSTGRPKGVMIEHRSAVNLISWVNREHRIGPDDRILMLSSPCFDLSVYDLFGGWAAGATVVIPEQSDLEDPGLLSGLVREQRITFWSSVPSTLRHLVRYLEETDPDWRYRGLETIFLSGDWIPLSLPGEAERFFPRARTVSLGGATEATVWSNHHPVERIDPSWSSIPYGKPIDNNTFYILDHRLDLVPPGVVGDLYIGGEGVARGYAGDPRKTAAAFVPDRFSADGAARLYRTGDLGRMLPAGEMEFLGRDDHQVKVRGYRVELGEIESTLRRHPALREAVVVVRDDAGGDTMLVAYTTGDGGPGSESLREHLGRSLPHYMVPELFVPLERLPLTANGKIDRSALPEPGRELVESSGRHVAPRDRTERILTEILGEVLGVDGIGIEHDFFELGGHSLSAVQAVTRIRRRFGVDLPLRALFASPTVAGLRRVLEQQAQGGASVPGGSTIPRREGGSEAPLSYPQERLLFLHQLDPASPAFNLGGAVRLGGRLDTAALSESFDEVVRRHEILRTTFHATAKGAMQTVHPPAPRSLASVDLSGLPATTRQAEADRIAHAEIDRPFDLECGPVLRTTLIRLEEEEHVVVFALHHIAGDGWSMNRITHEIADLYTAFVAGRPSPLPELTVQYADYATWQRQNLAEGELAEHLEYWRDKLAEPPPALDLGQRERGEGPAFRGRALDFRVPESVTRSLVEIGREEGATLFMTLMAGFKALLHRRTGERDLAVGSVVANRDRAEVEPMIGFFVNDIVLRTELEGEPTFRELVASERDVSLEAFAHQELPYEVVLERVSSARRGKRSSLFQVMFVLQNFPIESRELPGLTLTPVAFEPRTAPFDLVLTMTETDDGLTASFRYDTDLIPEHVVPRMRDQLLALLEQVAADPDRRVSDVALAGEEETQALLDAFNEEL